MKTKQQRLITKNTQEVIAAIYLRLSRDDGFEGESNSIGNQRDMLLKYCKDHGYTVHDVYVDDGKTGTNFDRPDFKRMMADIDKTDINAVIVKDLSRLGRNNAMVALYTEMIFPEKGIRFIAVNDSIDTMDGDNDIMPFKSIINEYYAKDISKKIRSAYRTKAINGEYTGAFAPYGYIKDPENKHKLIPDKETAPVVKRIFRLLANGVSPYKISVILKNDKILTPRAYISSKTGRYLKSFDPKHPYDWSNCTITTIARNRVYLGSIVGNKSTNLSYKNRKQVVLPQNEWIETKNVHEALIDEDTWNLVQPSVGKKKPPMKTGEVQIFSGLVKCSTCGCALSLAKQNDRKGNGNFACCKSRKKGAAYCSFHYITYDNLYQIVLEDIQKQISRANYSEKEFVDFIVAAKARRQMETSEESRKAIEKAEARLAELDLIFRRMYEDNITGKLPDSRYNVMMKSYDDEREDLLCEISMNRANLDQLREANANANDFLHLIKKYVHITELTAPILNELIEKIVVYDAVVVDGQRTQKVEIFYRFIGASI